MTAAFDRDKLGKVLALLTSNHPGEVVAAANRAVAMLKTAGMTFADLLKPAAEPARFNDVSFHEGYAMGRAAGLAESKSKSPRRNAHYHNGYAEGHLAGLKEAVARSREEDRFKEGYRSGYDEAEAKHQSVVNAAYARGVADGKAGVDLYAKPKRPRRKRDA